MAAMLPNTLVMKNRYFSRGFRVVFIFQEKYVLFNFIVSFCERKRYDLYKKKVSTEKANIPEHRTKEMYGGYSFQVGYEFLMKY